MLEKYNTRKNGLQSEEAAQRLRKFGTNELVPKHRISVFRLFIKQFRSPLILVLIIAAVISALLVDWLDSVIILTIVFASTIISFRQEQSARKAVEELRARISIKCTVLRDGKATEISAVEMVPGDVILLSAGSLVPADGRIIESTDLFVNEAALTGESFPAEKKPGVVDADEPLSNVSNSVFMGTSVRSGTASVVLTDTGARSQFGKIAETLEKEIPENDFERGVRHFSYLLTRIIFVLVLLVFLINIIDQKSTFESLLFAIALAVGMTPELLPAIITITLSHGAREMAKKGMIVKKLNAIETFGSMDVFCSDKTGTLTMGIITLDKALDSSGNPSDKIEQDACINAYFQQGLKNPLDESLLKLGEEKKYPFNEIKKVGEIPYDFVRKRLTIAVQNSDSKSTRLLSKGAFAQILSICDTVQKNNRAEPLSKDQEEQLTDLYKNWSRQGYRVLGIAEKILQNGQNSISKEDEEKFTFSGFLLFYDPPKEGVRQVLHDLRHMGVRLKIITGDNRYVTKHVAKQVGLNHMAVITGEKLYHIREEALVKQVQTVDLFAELDPQQKERIIGALKKAGYVVGYLGDGINDATALFEADVGISVDTAVDVAKGSADLVLLQHDLSILHETIKEGRVTFGNTLKYILTTSSANFGNMISMAAASAFLPFLPLLAKQILLNNFLSDIPAISLAGDRVDEKLISRPQKWRLPFIRNFMITFGLISTVFDFLMFGMLIWVFNASAEEFRTAWFIESLLTEVLIIFVIRTRGWFFRSRPHPVLLLNAFLVVVFSFSLPYLPISEITGFTPLSSNYLGAVVGISFLYIITTEAAKGIFYHHIEPSGKVKLSMKSV